MKTLTTALAFTAIVAHAGEPAPITVESFVKVAPPGYKATLFAEPPKLCYPVSLCAAGTGEVFVAVDRNGSLGKVDHYGSIMRLVDTDGDGKADTFDVVVADVDSPRGLFFDGRILYCLHPPGVTAYSEFGSDGKAGKVEELATGIGFTLKDHPADHTSNGIRMAIDGWIYMAIGDFGVPDGKARDGSTLSQRGGSIIRMRPDGSELELYARHTRNLVDVAIDPLLNGFIRDNTNDGGGWNSRQSYLVGLADYGYPSLYKRFSDEVLPPMKDYGGGSAVGALYLHEPGMPEGDGDTLFTCDWGTQTIYRHGLKPDGAGFTVDQQPWAKIDKVTDLDVDGNSRIYASSWRGGGFKYSGKDNVGGIIAFTPTGTQPAKFPDLKKATDAELITHLASPSAVCRQQTQCEILRRGTKPLFTGELTRLAKDTKLSLYVRIAGLFTLKSLIGAESHDTLLALTRDESIQEWALRALADRKTQNAKVPTAPFIDGLASANPRVRLQALIGLGRLGRPETAKAIVPLTAVKSEWKDAQRIIPHTAVQALILLKGIDDCLAVVSPGSTPDQIDGALWALKSLHDDRTVAGLVGKLAGSEPELRQKVLQTLVRLHQREGVWSREAKVWWSTKPDHIGPYYQRETWSGSPAIESALKAEMEKGPEEIRKFIVDQVSFHKVRIEGITPAAELAAPAGKTPPAKKK